MTDLSATIAAAFTAMTAQGADWKPDAGVLVAIEQAITGLDDGTYRAVTPVDGGWQGQDWVRQAILLYFRTRQAQVMDGVGAAPAFDKIPLKTTGWTDADFKRAGFRMVPGATVRRGAHIAPNCVLMPCFVNIGAYVGEGSMTDTWATVGSCAQVGKRVHISGGVGLGGVLEPLQARPVVIGDHAFIGTRSEIVEGVDVGEGAVIAMGTFISASTRSIDRASGEVHIGRVPPYAVVVPGSLPGASGGPALACGVIVKTVDEKTRAKTGVNDLLRAA